MTRLGLTYGTTYEILGPRGDRAVINDKADPDFVGYVDGDDGVTGLERAGVRENADDLAGGDGGLHGAFTYDRLAFTIKGRLEGTLPPFHDQQDKLLAATDAMRADSRLLWVANGIPVMLDFRQQQPTRITGRLPKSFLVAGVAEENVVVSQAEHLAEIIPGAAVPGGFASPLTSPLASSPGVDASAIVENAGRSVAWPILEVHGPGNNPVLTNFTEGKSLYLTYDLAAGERLVIDTDPRRRRIRLNDQASRWGALDFARSFWWGLRPGNNDLRVTFNSYSAGAKLVVRWRDAWG